MSSLKNLFKWQKGRQKTGYEKMLLAGAVWPIKFDLYLLKFPEGCEVPSHTDDVKNGRHYRLNIVLKQSQAVNLYVNLQFIAATALSFLNQIFVNIQ